MTDHLLPHRVPSRLIRAAILFVVLAGAGTVLWSTAARHGGHGDRAPTDVSSQARHRGAFHPTAAQWATLTVETVEPHAFRSQQVTEGKVSIDEDRSTPIFSPYSGRVTRLLVKPGDAAEPGQVLFVVEATDMVQAQNDFIAGLAAVSKARSQLDLTQTVETRMHALYQSKAIALREWQQAQADLTAAQSDLRSADVALEAARNRLRILGKTDQEIADFQETGRISPETPIYSPLGGTVVQRKVGPGQYVSASSTDPVFVIGDLSTVWLVAYVREADAGEVHSGQSITFTVLAYRDRSFESRVAYVASVLDPTTRRLIVRATIDNPRGLLKPEMFAKVSIFTDRSEVAVSVPRDAVIYEGDSARVRVARDDKSVELRTVKTGLADADLIQILEGLAPGEKVITRGSLFIDRVAAGI
jgi:cobalt-zinc-cadmium efflux system membrane fusion protein